MDSFGAYLKGHRESKGIRLEEIASITKIHLHNLELLESDRWEKLPPDPFLRGFIVAYGKYVGLDPKDLLGKYLESINVTPATAATATDGSVDDSPPPGDLIDQGPTLSTRKIFGGAGIVLIVALLGGIVYLGKRATDQSLKTAKTEEAAPVAQTTTGDHAPASLPAASAADTKAPAPETKTQAAAPPAMATTANNNAQAPAAAVTEHKVNIEGSERTWIKVVVDENAPIEYFLPQGEKVSYQAKQKIKVVLGNATGAKVFYNGKATEGVNFLGTIRSYKFPENAEFPQDTASRRMPTSDTPPAQN